MASVTQSAVSCETLAGVGTISWLDNAGSGVLNGDEASADDADNATLNIGSGEVSLYLKCLFDFDVPAGATIDGFEVKASERDNGIGGTVASTLVKLVKADAIVGNDIGAAAVWPGTETVVTYGSPTEKGGQTWTAAQVNATDFGCVVSVTTAAGMASTPLSPNLMCDLVQITVYYTEPQAVPSSLLILGVGE